MAKKKQVKRRSKARRGFQASKQKVEKSRGSSVRKQVEKQGHWKHSSRGGWLVAALWGDRGNWQRAIITLIGILVMALIGYLVVKPDGGAGLTERQKEAKDMFELLENEMAAKSWALEEMDAFLARDLPASDSEVMAASQAANRWGEAFSYLKLKTTYVKGPEWLWIFKEILPMAPAMYVEAAENVALLEQVAPEYRPTLFAQARRFLALGKAVEAAAFLTIRRVGDLPGKLSAREEYPLSADDVLAANPTPLLADATSQVLFQPSAMAGVPGSRLASVETQPAPQWAAGVRKIVETHAVTDTNNAFCDSVFAVKNGESVVAESFSSFIPRFRKIGNDLGQLTPPADGLAEAAGTVRAYRTYEEAATTGWLTVSLPDLGQKLKAKLFRVTLLSGNVWVWMRNVGQETGIYFINFPACSTGDDEFRQYVMLTPWDAREELKRELEGQGSS